MHKELHPWNRGFEWTPPPGPFTTISAAQARDYDTLGFFVFENAFDTPTLERLDRELQPGDEQVRHFLGKAPNGRFSVAGLDTQLVAPHAVLRSEWVREFCQHPILAGIAHDILGPAPRLYWEQSVFKQAHSVEPVLWHQDNGYTFVEPQSYLTCWIAITDATPENGCIAVMPGVHRQGTLAHRTTDLGQECWGDWSTATVVPAKAGDIVVFTSLTPHATFKNVTDDVRKAYIVQYTPDGAVAFSGNESAEVRQHRVPQNDPARQFLV